jgi:hypothetical protein
MIYPNRFVGLHHAGDIGPHCRPLFRGAEQMSTYSGYTRERMNGYRSGAMDAVKLAFPCDDLELRDVYLSIAKSWTELADKIERQLRATRAKE